MLLLTNKAVLEPRVSPAFAITYFCNHCNIRFENTSKYVDTLTLFSKNLNQRSLTPRWPLTPCLLRSHVWLYPRIIMSKSHDNTSMYVDTVINFAKYHTCYVHTTYYVQNEWSPSLLLNSVQARQKLLLTTQHVPQFQTHIHQVTGPSSPTHPCWSTIWWTSLHVHHKHSLQTMKWLELTKCPFCWAYCVCEYWISC